MTPLPAHPWALEACGPSEVKIGSLGARALQSPGPARERVLAPLAGITMSSVGNNTPVEGTDVPRLLSREERKAPHSQCPRVKPREGVPGQAQPEGVGEPLSGGVGEGPAGEMAPGPLSPPPCTPPESCLVPLPLSYLQPVLLQQWTSSCSARSRARPPPTRRTTVRSGSRSRGHRLRSRPCWPASPAAGVGACAGEDAQDRAPGRRALTVGRPGSTGRPLRAVTDPERGRLTAPIHVQAGSPPCPLTLCPVICWGRGEDGARHV